jgi:hypothetical protein
MMTALNHAPVLWAQERRQYRLLFFVIFVVFLIITPLARLLPSRWRPWPPVGGARLALIAEARAMTHRILPFAFL